MKKTVVTTVRARPVFRGAVSVTEGFISSRASITDFAERKVEGVGANPGTGAKNHRGEWAPNPGTDRTGSEFPAKCAGNPCQSCQSLGRSWVAMKSPWQFFMSFRGRNAHPNRRQKAMVSPTSLFNFEQTVCLPSS